MNDLALTNSELMQMVKSIEERKRKLATRSGQIAAAQEMLKILEYLEASGYKVPLPDNRAAVAKVWTDQLSECIELYGFSVIRRAAKEFVMSDKREYRQLPNAQNIAEVVKRLGYNPKRELAKRQQEADEQCRIAEANERAAEWARKQSPERLEELRRRYIEQQT